MISERIPQPSLPEDVGYDRTGPGTPAGRYLRRFWIPVAELTDVAPGRAKTIQIMSERFTFYRGTSGGAHLVANYCAHRHTVLGTGWVEGDCIRCFYHGWSYDADGQCVEQPAEDESFAEKVRIKAYPVREYQGLVWAYLGEGDPPPFQTFDLFEGEGVRRTNSYVRRTNFFNLLENSADWIHPYFVHSRSAFTAVGVNREIPKVWADETGFGIVAHQRYSDGKTGATYILMPLGMYIVAVSTPTKEHEKIHSIHHIAFRIPIDDYSHRSFMLTFAELTGDEAERYRENEDRAGSRLRDLTPGADVIAAILRGEMHVNEVDLERADIVGIQDSVVMEPQPPMSEREPDRLGRSDAPVILLRRIYAREMRAFTRGEPVKDWAWPRDLRAVPQV